MSTEREFSRGVAWMTVGGWIEQAMNFAIFVVLARILGAEAFGLLAMSAAFVVVAEFMVRDTLSEYLISHDAPDQDDCNAVFWFLALLGAALTGTILVLAPLMAGVYDLPQIAPLMMALSPTVGLVSMTAVPVALLRREMRFRVLALRAVAGVLAGGIVGLAMAASGAGVWALVAQRLTVVAVNVVLAWGATPFRPGRFRMDYTRRRGILAFGMPVLSLRTAELAVTQVPALLIGAVAGPVATGYYAFSWRLVETASFLVVTPLRIVAQPAFAGLRRANASAKALLLDLAQLASLLTFPAFAGLATLSVPFLMLVGGEKWVPAAPALAALALVGARQVVVQLEQSFCLAHNRVAALSAVAWAEVALGALAILLASGAGLAAMAWAFASIFFATWIVRLAIVGRIAGLAPFRIAACYVRPAVLAALMSAALLALRTVTSGWPALPELLAGTAVGFALYALLARYFLADMLALARRYLSEARAPSDARLSAESATNPPQRPAGDVP